MVEKPEDGGSVIQEFQTIIRSNRKNIIWLEYRQGVIFRKRKQRETFTNMVTKFSVSRSTIAFKISILIRFIEEFPKMKKTSLPLHFLKKHMKTIREICRDNPHEYRQEEKPISNLENFT